MKFTKLQGTGNDFIFTEDLKYLEIVDKRKFIQKICQRKLSVGADGFVFLEKKADSYKWQFYNADGSDAEMCGNAARCAGRYLSTKHQVLSFALETLAGQVYITKIENDFKVEMQILDPVEQINKDIYFVNSGVPHIVCLNPKSERDLIKKYRFHNNKRDALGANVSMLDTTKEIPHVKTFERGVEDFTLGCGTGAVAAAAVLQKTKAMDSVCLIMPGGELRVDFENDKVFLIGPAELIFEGEIHV